MPTKPTPIEIGAYENMQKNPTFGRDVLEATINEVPMLADALLQAGLVEEVTLRQSGVIKKG